LAISGGPDSLALLLLAHAGFPNHIAAATVDHGLRREASDEAQYVGEICRDLGVPHAILSPPSPITGNLQSQARKARYALLEDWRARENLGWIATAHHADDQLETLVMRLNRSSGVAGLAGIRARNGSIVRPVLGWQRIELGDILAEADLPFVDDPSNRDHRYDRARLRAALADADWLDPRAVAKSAALLGEASEAIEWMTAQRLRSALVDDGGVATLAYRGEPHALWHRMVLSALERAQPGIMVGEAAYRRLAAAMARGDKASIGDLTVSPIAGQPKRWTICAAPARCAKAAPSVSEPADKTDRT